MITTPNEEVLSNNAVFCPECGHEFHRWQHLRSWSADSLASALARHGFEPLFCQGMNLAVLQSVNRESWKNLSPSCSSSG